MKGMQARYLKNNWGLTKFCVSQFSGRNPKLGKSGRKAMKQAISQAKSFEDMEVVIDGWEGGADVFGSICECIRRREEQSMEVSTPRDRIGLVPTDIGDAPRWPSNERRLPGLEDGDSPTPDRPIRNQRLIA